MTWKRTTPPNPPNMERHYIMTEQQHDPQAPPTVPPDAETQTQPTPFAPTEEPETETVDDAPPAADSAELDDRSDYDRFREETPDDYDGDVTAFNERSVPVDEKGALRDDSGDDHAGEAVMRSVTGHNPPED